MAEDNIPISAFAPDESPNGPTAEDWVAGYRDLGLGTANPNIRYNLLAFAQWIIANVSTGTSGKGIVSGGATYTGTGMDFIVEAEAFYFGETGTVSGNVTLDDGDELPRIDLIVVEVNGGVFTPGVVKGTPAENPAEPAPAENQIRVQLVHVAALATTPDITVYTIYNEDVPGEWAGSTYDFQSPPIGTVNFADTNDPYTGTVCVGAHLNPHRGIRFTAPAPVNFNEVVALRFAIRITAPLAADRQLLSSVWYQGSSTGQAIDLTGFGFDRNSSEWQVIIVPTSMYNVLANNGQVDRIHLRMNGSNDDPVSFFLDFIGFTTGIPTPEPSIPPLNQVLNSGNETGAKPIVVNPGASIDFEAIIGTIMKFAGSVGDERLVNAAGNLLFKVLSLGVSPDGAGNTCQMNASGLFTALLVGSKSYYQPTMYVLTDAATTVYQVDDGDIAQWTIGGDRSFMFAGPRIGTKTLIITQGGLGGHTVSWDANILWPEGTEPTLSTEAGAIDIISFVGNGSKYFGTLLNNFG